VPPPRHYDIWLYVASLFPCQIYHSKVLLIVHEATEAAEKKRKETEIHPILHSRAATCVRKFTSMGYKKKLVAALCSRIAGVTSHGVLSPLLSAFHFGGESEHLLTEGASIVRLELRDRGRRKPRGSPRPSARVVSRGLEGFRA